MRVVRPNEDRVRPARERVSFEVVKMAALRGAWALLSAASFVTACGGESTVSAPPTGSGGAGTVATGGTSGAVGSGGVAQGGTSGSSGATQGGSGGTVATGGAGGAATGGSSGASATTADLTGTWIADVQTKGTESVPVAGTVDANIRIVMRLVLTETASALDVRYDICELTAVSTPDPTALGVTFTPAVIATLTTTVSEPFTPVSVGDAIGLPPLTILSGIDGSGNAVDADADTHPGVTVPGTTWNNTSVNAYVGLTIQTTPSPKLTAPDAMGGTVSFAANGKVFGSDNPLLTSGDISVVPDSTAIPFTAKLLAGDVPCSDVLKALP
jgi:hypothetical protein